MSESTYPGTYWPLIRITPITGAGQNINVSNDVDKNRVAFMTENAFNYNNCSKWVQWARQNYGGPVELDATRKSRCDIDVCKVGCNRIGLSVEDTLPCIQACESGKLFTNACDYLVTRNLDNATLANAGCGEQLTNDAAAAAAAAAASAKEAGKEQMQAAKDFLKKYLPVVLVIIFVLILINYL